MTILLQVQLLPSSPSPDEKSLKQKKRPPEGSLFLERKTRLERRLACVCLSRTPLSRLRRQLPRGAVASPSPDEKSLKQKKETTRRQSLLGAENETRTRDPNLGKVVLYQLSYFRKIFDFALNLAAARHRIDSLRSPCTNFPHFPYGSASSF